MVEGFLDLPDDHAALATLRDEFEFDGDEELILSRTVAAGGRSRAHVAGRSVPASVLAQVGHDLLIFVEVLLDRTTGDVFEAFAEAVRRQPEVLECHMVAGGFDYLIKARVGDMDA